MKIGDNGIAVTYKDGRQEDVFLVTDTAGGAILVWDDDPTENIDPPSSNFDIYAQRLSSSGVAQWKSGGVPICIELGEQTFPQMVVDGSGGAIIIWHDKRSGNYDIYTQQLDSGGEVVWTANGVAVCQTTSEQLFPRITTGDTGEAIVAWQDARSGEWGIYSQKISVSGGGGGGTTASSGGCSLIK